MTLTFYAHKDDSDVRCSCGDMRNSEDRDYWKWIEKHEKSCGKKHVSYCTACGQRLP